jgi:4-amino-4-deoxy-L-arabinose transferase-like glycosyltransferase
LGPSSSRAEALAWLLALAAAAVALAALGYEARDADSRLYAEIAARMAPLPVSQWIAPSFPPGWYMSGLFREHPVGIHLLPALLARLGYPAPQAALAVNGLYVALSLVLLQRLAASVVKDTEARTVGFLAQLLPIAFTFRIRANHEAAVLLCMLLALVGVERARRRPLWGLVVVAGLVGLFLVKGVLAVMGFAACALWLVVRRSGSPDAAARDRPAWLALLAALAAVGATSVLYEHLYRQATGAPFWSFYLGRQLGVAAVEQSSAFLAQKAFNLVWYFGRVLWFPFPWSLTLAAALVSRKARPQGASDGGTRAGALFVVGFTLLYLGAFSLSDRRADRYIFPVYYAVGAGGVVAALRAWPRLRSLAETLDRAHAWKQAALWLALFALHILAGRLGVPTVKVWAPDS